MHQVFCLSPSGISFLKSVWFSAACVLQVMEEIDCGPLHFEFLREMLRSLCSFLLVHIPPVNQSTFILQRFFLIPLVLPCRSLPKSKVSLNQWEEISLVGSECKPWGCAVGTMLLLNPNAEGSELVCKREINECTTAREMMWVLYLRSFSLTFWVDISGVTRKGLKHWGS